MWNVKYWDQDHSSDSGSELDDSDVGKTCKPEGNSSENDIDDPRGLHQDITSLSESTAAPEVLMDTEGKEQKKNTMHTRLEKKKKAKRNRSLGLEYTDCKGKVVSARSLKPTCQRNQFIAKQSIVVNPKYRRVTSTHKTPRGLNDGCYFDVYGKKLRVCKRYFMDTLDVGDKMIRNVIKNLDDVFVEPLKRGNHFNHKTLDPAITERIVKHINCIPRVESHYLRQQISRQYINSSKTIADLHRDYVTYYRNHNVQLGNHKAYRNIFVTRFNLGSFVPKKRPVFFLRIPVITKTCRKVTTNTRKNVSSAGRQNKWTQIDLKKWSALQPALACKLSCLHQAETFRNSTTNVGSRHTTSLYSTRVLALAIASFDTRAKLNVALIKLVPAYMPFCREIPIVLYSDNCSGQNINKFVVSLYTFAVISYDILSISRDFFYYWAHAM
ncbi:hypothetical protein PR048_021249 [Dryococelus australis]|uniref:Uncharacterized protein n=1 Tax=Dryococelus australis TaxID=614101 RepID=A0ABQ9GXS1_9NEOP|nr:hypothetical protein PR048_021249 [Dryococelus australis]